MTELSTSRKVGRLTNQGIPIHAEDLLTGKQSVSPNPSLVGVWRVSGGVVVSGRLCESVTTSGNNGHGRSQGHRGRPALPDQAHLWRVHRFARTGKQLGRWVGGPARCVWPLL